MHNIFRFLLALSRRIDALNNAVGKLAYWLVLAVVLVSSVNAIRRAVFNEGSNGWLELQWVLFSGIFLLCAGYALLHNAHVRIDVVYARCSRRTQLWIDILGTLFFLLPMAILILFLSWPVFITAYVSGEASPNAGGLVYWPARLLVPVGFLLLTLQGFSELIKRIAILRGIIADPVLEANTANTPTPEQALAHSILAASGNVNASANNK